MKSVRLSGKVADTGGLMDVNLLEEEEMSGNFLEKFDQERLGIVKHAKLQPDKVALIMNDLKVTYKELDEDTNALANAFWDQGIRPGDRICILFNNSPEILKAWTAAGKMSVTPIALNFHFKADELAYIVNDSESKLLIYADEFDEVIEQAKPKFNSASFIYIRSGGSPLEGVLRLEELLQTYPRISLEIENKSFGVPSTLVYTSGTTGRPKGAVRSSSNRLNSLMGYACIFESTYDDIHLVAGPLYHAAPYAWAAFSLILGNTVIVMPRFNAEEFLRLVDKYKVTTVWVVPTMLNRILNLPEEVKVRYDISSLKSITVGGESFPFPLKERAVDKPTMGNEIVLLDENKNEVPVGEVGIMYVKSPFLLDEYYKNPEATKANYHNGYFTVGDMARVDEDGFYYILDRAVDMIISGGVNIYPAEIEEILYRHPDIFDAAIIGVPDPDWGERIVAQVVPKVDAQLTEQDVKDYVGENLASYKKPREVYFVEELPYSSSGKLLKRVLREEYKQKFKQKFAR